LLNDPDDGIVSMSTSGGFVCIEAKSLQVDMLTIRVISPLKSSSMYLQDDGHYSEMGTLPSTGFDHDTEASGRQL